VLAHHIVIADYFCSKGIITVLCGSQKETKLAEDIISLSNSKGSIVNLSGQTDLSTLSHILGRSICYFGSDTGILHLAVAVGAPAIAIVGMGGLDRFFPYGDTNKNRAVYVKTQRYKTGSWADIHLLTPGEIHPSIKNITVEDAKKEIDYLLHYLSL
jgi:ADP-heptose:LPS heptosyltransferase